MISKFKLLAGFFVLSLGASVQADQIACNVATNNIGIKNIVFNHPSTPNGSLNRYFNLMTLVFTNGASQHFVTQQALSGFTERKETSIFKGVTGGSLVVVQHQFFVVPGQENPRGFSPKNGVHIELVVPNSSALVRARCQIRK